MLKKKIAEIIKEQMYTRTAALASGILVGNSSQVAEQDSKSMRVVGTAHFIAIFEVHIAVIAGIIFFLLNGLS
ncbi:MAG: ComEC/Rec2 family competence protein [Candidatus Midichloria sp.]|nr:MAG: ComEC/Rec2 family competence protein [Candidatus Midichloria sp.]